MCAVPRWVRHHTRELLPQRDQQQEHQPQERKIARYPQYKIKLPDMKILRNKHIYEKGFLITKNASSPIDKAQSLLSFVPEDLEIFQTFLSLNPFR